MGVRFYGFFLDRKWKPGVGVSQFEPADTLWTQVFNQLGNGSSYSEKAYEFFDETASRAGEYSYRLKQQDFNGVSTIYGPYVFVQTKPEENDLLPNYPNPFNPETVVPFILTNESRVLIQLFDITGRKVMDVTNKTYSPGRYRITLNASKLASGIYLLRMNVGNDVKTRKIMLLR